MRKDRILQIRAELLKNREERKTYIDKQEAIIDAHFSPLLSLVEYNSAEYKQLKEEKQKMKDEIHKQAFNSTSGLAEELHRLEREEYGK